MTFTTGLATDEQLSADAEIRVPPSGAAWKLLRNKLVTVTAEGGPQRRLWVRAEAGRRNPTVTPTTFTDLGQPQGLVTVAELTRRERIRQFATVPVAVAVLAFVTALLAGSVAASDSRAEGRREELNRLRPTIAVMNDAVARGDLAAARGPAMHLSAEVPPASRGLRGALFRLGALGTPVLSTGALAYEALRRRTRPDWAA